MAGALAPWTCVGQYPWPITWLHLHPKAPCHKPPERLTREDQPQVSTKEKAGKPQGKGWEYVLLGERICVFLVMKTLRRCWFFFLKDSLNSSWSRRWMFDIVMIHFNAFKDNNFSLAIWLENGKKFNPTPADFFFLNSLIECTEFRVQDKKKLSWESSSQINHDSSSISSFALMYQVSERIPSIDHKLLLISRGSFPSCSNANKISHSHLHPHLPQKTPWITYDKDFMLCKLEEEKIFKKKKQNKTGGVFPGEENSCFMEIKKKTRLDPIAPFFLRGDLLNLHFRFLQLLVKKRSADRSASWQGQQCG